MMVPSWPAGHYRILAFKTQLEPHCPVRRYQFYRQPTAISRIGQIHRIIAESLPWTFNLPGLESL
jgi:hypothetical protein